MKKTVDILHLSHTCMFIDISDSMVEFSIEIILLLKFHYHSDKKKF